MIILNMKSPATINIKNYMLVVKSKKLQPYKEGILNNLQKRLA